jgi:hypothetical protein
MMTRGQKDALDKLFDAWESVSINTDEDLSRLGDSYPEDE